MHAVLTGGQVEVEDLIELTTPHVLEEQESRRLTGGPHGGSNHGLVEERELLPRATRSLHVVDLRTGRHVQALPVRMPAGESRRAEIRVLTRALHHLRRDVGNVLQDQVAHLAAIHLGQGGRCRQDHERHQTENTEHFSHGNAPPGISETNTTGLSSGVPAAVET